MHGTAVRPIVLKAGGSLMDDPSVLRAILADAASLWKEGKPIILVHGGGNLVTTMSARFGITPRFVGHPRKVRVTDEETMRLFQMVCAGLVNPWIVGELAGLGVNALGISGHTGRCIVAERFPPVEEGGKIHDIGWAGRVVEVRPEPFRLALDSRWMPVVAPVGVDGGGHAMNINGDDLGARLAVALESELFVNLTSVPGVFRDAAGGPVHERLTAGEARALLAGGTLTGGGIVPKVEACVAAVEGGCARAVIASGRVPEPVRRGVAGRGTVFVR